MALPSRLPLPPFATRPWFFLILVAVHLYLGAGHVIGLATDEVTWTHTWKGFGALFGSYYFASLGLRSGRGEARSHRDSTTHSST